MGSIEATTPKPTFEGDSNTLEYAKALDAKDPLRSFRDKYIIPSKANIKSKVLAKPGIARNPIVT